MPDSDAPSFDKYFAVFLVVLLFGLLFRIIFLNAPLQSDDTTYFSMAANLSADLFTNARYQAPFRLGLLIPLALFQVFFGYTLVAYYAYSVSFSLILLAMIYGVSFKIDGLRTALFSSLLFACSFYGLNQTTNVLPDVPNLVLLLASFLTFLYVDTATGRRRILILFVSAFLAFCSYLVRAPNLVFLLAIPVYELLTRRSLNSTFLFSIIFLILWIGESCFYLIIADDFFLRVKMIPKGSTLWVSYMPELSWQAYLQEPFTRLTSTLSGTIILWGGFAGTIIAIWKKNRGMIALIAGALLLFIIYSYAVTSFSPLRRALPLQTRYIVPFTAVLTIATGYALSSLKPGLKNIFPETIATLVLALIAILLLGIQIKELPNKLPNTILFKDSAYFVADKLLEDTDKIVDIKGKAHAYPLKDFNMYPNYSQLNLKAFSPSDMKGGMYYLYSRKRVQKDLFYGYLGHDEKVERNQNLLLLRNNPTWNYIVNTKDIVLAYIPSFENNITEVMSLTGAYFSGYWSKPEFVIEQNEGNSVIFHFNQEEKPFYLLTFPGQFSLPPREDIDIFNRLKPNEIYELKIQYRIEKEIQNMNVFFSQYSNIDRIDNVSVNAPSTPGAHTLTKLRVTTPSYEKFRLFFRIINKQQENILEIEKISFNLLSGP